MCFRILTMGSFRRLGRDEALSRHFLVLRPSSCIIHLISRHCCDTHNIFAGGDTPQKLNKTKTEAEIKVSNNLQLPPQKTTYFWNFTFKYSNFTHPGSHLKPRWPCNEYFLDDSMNHSWRGRLRSLFDRLCDQWLRQQNSRTGEDTKFQAHFCFCVLGEGVIWDGSYSWPDAKAALLSFFRSLVFGTVPEAISKLSLEGVGLKREKKMCVIKPIFFQDGEGKYV